MPTVNRAALILKPRPAFLKWVNEADPHPGNSVTMEDIQRDLTVYLIPDYDLEEAAAEFLKANFDFFFEDILWGYYRDESLWPQNRTYELFCRWFDYSVYSMVDDVVAAPLIREDLP